MPEGRGNTDSDGSKTAYAQARLLYQIETWNERTSRLFAADCAERVAHLYKLKTEWQPAQIIEVVRRYANGEATKEELAAAGAAAGEEYAAAWAAERKWQWARLLYYIGNEIKEREA
mgnify:CR=1 FL=1